MAVRGTVTKWSSAERLGWIKSEAGDEVSVPASSLPPGARLLEGHSVRFDLDADMRSGAAGHPAAANVAGPGLSEAAPSEAPDAAAAGTVLELGLTGTVREWNGQYGYITRGRELVYCNAKGISGGGVLIPGKTVAFDVEDTGHHSGRRVARNVRGDGVRTRGKMTGWVKSWNFERGYGFIEAATGEQVFCHMTSISDGYLVEQRPVTFDVITVDGGEKGERLRAVNVDGPGLRDGRSLPAAHAHVQGYGGGEKRRDPTDGNRYTKREFFDAYGGYREWDSCEERVSPQNGKPYTRDQFLAFYGGLVEWNAAPSASAAAAAPQTAGAARPRADWSCRNCGQQNFASKAKCAVCGSQR